MEQEALGITYLLPCELLHPLRTLLEIQSVGACTCGMQYPWL